jgi:mRNA-degrading endonuclease RelE of RelBE toxin-antitoxin system
MYTIEYHQSVKDDLKKLGHSIALLVVKKLRK